MRMSKKDNIFFLFMLIFTLFLGAIPVNATEEPTVIKVGYTLNYGTIKSPVVGGQKGYGYEYLTKIFEYAKGDYELEFVYCTWLEAADMLLSGEVDILGPTTSTEWGQENYLYSDESFGDNVIMLSALSTNNVEYHDYSDIDNSVIAVQYNNPNEYMLYEFLEERGLDADIVYFENNDYEQVMQENDYDFCLCSSLQTLDSMTPVAKLGTTDFYYVTSGDNQELMDEINYGMEQIEQKEYLYQEKLYLEYYDYYILSYNYITDEEYELLQSKDLYYIGVENLYSPICYKDENDNFAGIAIDALDMIMDSASLNYTIMEITDQTTTAEYNSLDFAMLSLDHDDDTMVASDPYYSMTLTLVESHYDENHDFETIGLLEYFSFDEYSLPILSSNQVIIEYNYVTELVDAYNKGEIESFIMTSASLNLSRNSIEDLNFISTTLDTSLNLVLMFPEDYSSEMISIFNKLIGQINTTELDTSLLMHSTEDANYGTYDFLVDNPWLMNLAIVFILVMTILSEIARKKTLRKALDYDELTGLYSKHKFLTEARKILKAKNNNKYMIITIDIDNFKYINEFFGYSVGSEVIKTLGECIQEDATHALLLARHESDKFLLLLENNDRRKNLNFSMQDNEKLITRLRPLIGNTYNITFSIGAYMIEDRTLSLNFMIDCANIARNLGKDSAFVTINVFSPEMNHKRILTNEIVSSMTNAIQEHEFVLYYQPKVDMISGQMVGAEALVRWYKDGKIIPPNEFISIFEKNSFIETLDCYVLTEVCRFIHDNPLTPKISVNISGITIVKKDIVKTIISIIDSFHVSYEKVDIEITETAFMGNMEEVINNINEIRSYGITISIDDFGVGISSLSRLKDMPIDTLKIDREFIIDCIENPKGREIIKSVITLAKEIHLETVAEGIETKEQDEFLTSLGCDVGQGYYFSRPQKEEDFIKQLDKKASS